MKNIAIVEDDAEAADLLERYLSRYTETCGEEFKIARFCDPISFLTNYKANYDIVCMDIKLPGFDGMKAARKMRELDKDVTLIFVTNMAQYAVNGYEVGALDFIVKPVTYPNFALKLHRAFTHIEGKKGNKVYISVENGVMCFSSSEIMYVEIIKHRIIYHTRYGDYFSHGTLKKAEMQIADSHFVKCNSCYLVNLRYVTAVVNYEAFLGDIRLQISHPKRRDFLRALNDYLGGGA